MFMYAIPNAMRILPLPSSGKETIKFLPEIMEAELILPEDYQVEFHRVKCVLADSYKALYDHYEFPIIPIGNDPETVACLMNLWHLLENDEPIIQSMGMEFHKVFGNKNFSVVWVDKIPKFIDFEKPYGCYLTIFHHFDFRKHVVEYMDTVGFDGFDEFQIGDNSHIRCFDTKGNLSSRAGIYTKELSYSYLSANILSEIMELAVQISWYDVGYSECFDVGRGGRVILIVSYRGGGKIIITAYAKVHTLDLICSERSDIHVPKFEFRDADEIEHVWSDVHFLPDQYLFTNIVIED